MRLGRAARAVGPRPEPESLRSAYLELLKLCLCDLCGSSTVSVTRKVGAGSKPLVQRFGLPGDEGKSGVCIRRLPFPVEVHSINLGAQVTTRVIRTERRRGSDHHRLGIGQIE